VGRRDHIRLSTEEISAYLDAPRNMVIATLNADGTPHLTAVSYVMDGTSPVFWTYAKSQKVRNIERDPRVSCLVEDGELHSELRGVMLTGTARVSRDPELIEATWRRLTVAYRGPIDVADVANFERQRDKRCVVTVAVRRTVSWDHRKLPVSGVRPAQPRPPDGPAAG
jgi:PPOX class probable F420-dependent enzyme